MESDISNYKVIQPLKMYVFTNFYDSYKSVVSHVDGSNYQVEISTLINYMRNCYQVQENDNLILIIEYITQ